MNGRRVDRTAVPVVLARGVAGILGAAAGVLWLLCMYLVAASGFSGDPAADPHGFGLMFGTVVGVVAGLLSALVLPAAFPAARRRRISRICLGLFVGTTAVLYAALYLA